MTPFQSVWELCIIITESNLNTNPQFFHCIYGNILFTFYQQYPKRLPYWYYIENHSRHIRLVSTKKNITKFKIRLAYVWTHSKNCKSLDPRSSSWKFLWKTFILYYARRTTIHFYSARTFFVRKSKLCNTTIMTAHYEAKNSFHVSPLYGGFWENIWIKKNQRKGKVIAGQTLTICKFSLSKRLFLSRWMGVGSSSATYLAGFQIGSGNSWEIVF